MSSPFKFLDAYEAADKDAFFGREKEIAELYSMVTRNRLILIYGQSGAGKTSLVQCGLASRFDPTDWFPVAVRRQHDINESLRQRLQQAASDPALDRTPDLLDDIYVNWLRPVYLIFDQLEELFVFGDAPEIEAFVANIRAVLDSSTPCRVVFVIREEYLVHLYEIERAMPQLFDRRLRVEPMSRARVAEVLEGSFRRFNIRAEGPVEATYELIARQVGGQRAGIQLPFLQVWLDRFYRRQLAGSDERASDGDWPALEFTRARIEQFGAIEGVLEDFLAEQQQTLQRRLTERFPDAPATAVADVLDAFVSEEGTKRPIGYERRGDALVPEPRWAHLFQPLPAEALAFCCAGLEQARLLRFSDDYVELAHDSLAAVIDSRRSQLQRRLAEAYNRLRHAFGEYRQSGELLSRRQLNSLEDYLPALEPRLDAAMRAFVAASAERARHAEQAALEAERRKRRQARRVAAGGLTLAGLALVGFFVALAQYRAAERAKTAIAGHAFDAGLSLAATLKVQGRYGEALDQLDALEPAAAALPPERRDTLNVLHARWQELQRLVPAADTLGARGDLLRALVYYDSARTVDTDSRLETLRDQTAGRLEVAFADYLRRGDALLQAGQKQLAAEYYRKALTLKPADQAAAVRLERCRQE